MFNLRSIVFVVSLALMVFTLPTFAAASQGIGTTEKDQGYLKMINEHQQAVAELKAKIMEQADPQVTDLQAYLHKAMFLVYSAKIFANSQLDPALITSTNDLHQLVSLGYLTEWPGNPFAGWAPMAVRAIDDGFSAGDLCFDLCPESEYTPFNAGLTPVSFNLYVYGVDEDMAALGSISQMKENDSWTEVPEGALYGLSYHMMTQAEHEAALEAERQFKEGRAD